MSPIKTLAALAVAAAAFSSAPALANPSVRVTFGDLDLSRPEGMKTLNQRINRAVRAVCGVYNRGPHYRSERSCERETAARARADLANLRSSAPTRLAEHR